MSKYITQTERREIDVLLRDIDRGRCQLPNFQRPLRWKPDQVLALLRSLLKSHPAGSIIKMNYRGDNRIAFHPFDSSPGIEAPSYLVLDGQQRLTNLYHAFTGRGGFRYFLNLRLLAEGKSLDDEGTLFFMPAEPRTKAEQSRLSALGTDEVQRDEMILPFSEFGIGVGESIQIWIDRISDSIADADEARDYSRRLKVLTREFVDPVNVYRFPEVELEADVTLDAICTIFEQMNSTGVQLGAFDLLNARFFPFGIELNKRWESAQTDFGEELARLASARKDFEPLEILRAISLIATYEKSVAKHSAEGSSGTPTAKAGQSAVLELEPESINKYWDAVVEGFVVVAQFLCDHVGLYSKRLNAYTPMAVPLAAFVARELASNRKNPLRAEMSYRAIRWHWASIFSQAYEQGANSQVESDFVALVRWMEKDEEPRVVRDFDPSGLDLRTVKSGAVYRGFMALLASTGPSDLKNAHLLRSSIENGSVEDHHVFPKAYLKKKFGTRPEATDCILNRILIDKDTNRFINDRPPSEYLQSILDTGGTGKLKGVVEQLSRPNLNKVLKSHLLPSEDGSTLWCDDFEGFLDVRERALRELMESSVREE